MDLASLNHYVAYDGLVTACREVDARRDVEQLAITQLRTILPFESLRCSLIRLADAKVLDALFLGDSAPRSVDTDAGVQAGACPAIREWIKRRAPVLVTRGELPDEMHSSRENLAGRNDFRAVHGMTDISQTTACLFSFARGRPWSDADRVLLERVVPHLYYAVSRARDFGTSLPLGPLTQREQQVLQWVCSGKSNTEISSILDISTWTVKIHISHLLAKLNASNRSHAVAKAISFKLVTL